ncbi:MAG: gliding motility-associated C-terminal domain-containing protein [Flavobacteriales bacterium]|nr:gliding motility-associated C-terminal domain-containing protein [Flavobacteriales bacterium]
MSNITYTVTVTDQFGCTETEQVTVSVFPTQFINLGPNVVIPFGGSVQLFANGNGNFSWEPDTFLTCNNCPNPTASPFSSTHYFVTLTDANGCNFYDSIWVFVEGSLYVPNTFTPNRDGLNDFFLAFGTEIKEFEMLIFNRWGEQIFRSTSLQEGWDGTHRNQKCPIGVYAWRILYTENSGKEGVLIGHVNLLR